jgi:signal peptidase
MSSPRRRALGLLALLAVAAAAPVAAYAAPGLVGADRTRIVLTGSMEPTLTPGDVVFLDEDVTVENLAVGDIVTFRGHENVDTTYTHRVVDVRENTGGTVLVTKGDANEDPDPMRVDDAMLVGRVDHQLPGYGKAIALGDELPLELVLVGLSLVTVIHELVAIREHRQDEDAEDPTAFEVVR